MEARYYTTSSADSYGSARGLQRHFSRRRVAEFLPEQDAYTLHRDVRRRFARRKTVSTGINDLWQCDLVDLSALSRSNDNYKYLLTCIDVLSKYGRVVPIKNKTAGAVTNAFAEMIKDVRPRLLQTDKGTEFLNSTFQKLLSVNGIKHYTSQNDDIKCAVVERWHRTLLAKLYRYFTHVNTERYIDIIQQMVESYNHTWHSTIKTAPVEVDEHNESQIRERLLSSRLKPTSTVTSKLRFSVGDTVRISGTRRAFAKGYRDKWSEEVFKVVKIYNTEPTTYGLTDTLGEPIEGKFYPDELQQVRKDIFRIEKIIRTRKRPGGKIEYYVKWTGYSDKFNSWVDNIST
jgi:transposase InsO family protein